MSEHDLVDYSAALGRLVQDLQNYSWTSSVNVFGILDLSNRNQMDSIKLHKMMKPTLRNAVAIGRLKGENTDFQIQCEDLDEGDHLLERYRRRMFEARSPLMALNLSSKWQKKSRR